LILSIAHAPVDDPEAGYIFGAWSNIVVGERPAGLVDCYLSQTEGEVQMISVWNTAEDRDQALDERETNPEFGFFEACGLDPTHTTYKVIGRLGE